MAGTERTGSVYQNAQRGAGPLQRLVVGEKSGLHLSRFFACPALSPDRRGRARDATTPEKKTTKDQVTERLRGGGHPIGPERCPGHASPPPPASPLKPLPPWRKGRTTDAVRAEHYIERKKKMRPPEKLHLHPRRLHSWLLCSMPVCGAGYSDPQDTALTRPSPVNAMYRYDPTGTGRREE
jgi:hypothetical protein